MRCAGHVVRMNEGRLSERAKAMEQRGGRKRKEGPNTATQYTVFRLENCVKRGIYEIQKKETGGKGEQMRRVEEGSDRLQ